MSGKSSNRATTINSNATAPDPGSDIKHSVRLLRSTVSQIQSLGIPASPENYSIWFNYYAESKPALNSMIDKRLENGGNFNAEFSYRVFSQFFMTDPEKELKSVRSAIRAMIAKLSAELGDIDKGMNEYGIALEDCAKELEKAPEVKTLDEIVQRLISETKKCRDSTQNSCAQVSQLSNEIEKMKASLAEMSEAAMEDALTGIANRRAFDEAMEKHIADARKDKTPVCLILLDIDLFKRVNDKFGHIVGDRVLRFVAEMIKRSVKGHDFVARFGGEEFAIILPNTGCEGATVVARSILNNVSNTRLKVNKEGESLGKITLSGGVACLKNDDDMESLIDRADANLYQAKNSGRNGIITDAAEFEDK